MDAWGHPLVAPHPCCQTAEPGASELGPPDSEDASALSAGPRDGGARGVRARRIRLAVPGCKARGCGRGVSGRARLPGVGGAPALWNTCDAQSPDSTPPHFKHAEVRTSHDAQANMQTTLSLSWYVPDFGGQVHFGCHMGAVWETCATQQIIAYSRAAVQSLVRNVVRRTPFGDHPSKLEPH